MPNKRFEKMKSFSDYVQNMINGLKKEWVPVKMHTYGLVIDEVCYGCAATNALCELMGEPFTLRDISERHDRVQKFNYDITWRQLLMFEESVDSLRLTLFRNCIRSLKNIEDLLSFKVPDTEDIIPPFDLSKLVLVDAVWRLNLPNFEKYVEWLKQKGL